MKYAWAEMPTGSSGSPVTISYTVSYSIGADSVNKDQAFVLLTYLAGPDGMEKWTAGGVALPSRKDVPIPGRQGRAGQGQRLRPAGLRFHARLRRCPEGVPGRLHGRRSKGKTYEAGPVVDATKAAIDEGPGPVAPATS